ncbi:MAG: hypothetical protein RIC35_10725 [Marinoscillum sp.]
MKKLFPLILIVLALGCNTEPIRIGTEVNNLPAPEISELENNLNFHEQTIELIGYYRSGFEMSGLFTGKKNSEKEKVWVDFSRGLKEQVNDSIALELEGRKLRVQGTYNAKSHGHIMQYIGTIELDFLETLN